MRSHDRNSRELDLVSTIEALLVWLAQKTGSWARHRALKCRIWSQDLLTAEREQHGQCMHIQ